MKAKKIIILNAARELFNNHGYDNVTIRMIAVHLKMSSGNLNYHYKKREDILESLYFEMVSEFDARVDDLPKMEVSIKQISEDVEKSMKRMQAYVFFWTDLYNLLSLNEKVSTHFHTVYKKRIQGCFWLFKEMREKKILQIPSFPGEDNFLAEKMLHYGNTWLYGSKLYSHEKNIDHYVKSYIHILYPYLTEKGKNECKILWPGFY